MTTKTQNPETTKQGETIIDGVTITTGTIDVPLTPEQLAEKQAELQALSDSLEDKEKALLEKEQALDGRISEVNQKEADIEEQYQQLKNELETKVEELRAEKEALLEKEQELTAKEAELEEKSNALTKALDEGMEEGEVSLEQFLRDNAHPDGIQFSEYVLKVTNGPESHLEGFIRPNPYGGQTKSVKITATLVKVN